MRLFVVGRDGQVARSLREAAANNPTLTFRCSSRTDFDLLTPSSVERAIVDFRPDLVINPAAYTAVDRAETERNQAYAINAEGAGAIAAAAAKCGAPIIHFSTDYVFDGTKSGPYIESDEVNPQSVYGQSKLAGELAVARENPLHIVLRTAWVYSPFGSNFLRTMLRLAGERDRLRVVDDQFGCPTYAPDIADSVIAMIALILEQGWRREYAGVTHLAGPDAMSWCAFAREVITQSARRGGRSIPVDPITTSDYPTPAPRPANSCLSTQRLSSVFGLKLPAMQQSISNCLDRLSQTQSGIVS